MSTVLVGTSLLPVPALQVGLFGSNGSCYQPHPSGLDAISYQQLLSASMKTGAAVLTLVWLLAPAMAVGPVSIKPLTMNRVPLYEQCELDIEARQKLLGNLCEAD